MYDPDRRRLLIAAIVTMIAVPAFLLFNRSGGDDSTDAAASTAPAPTPAGNVINPLPEQVAETSATTEPPAGSVSQLPPIQAPDDDPIFMNGPVAIEEDEIAEVAVPAQPAVPPVMIDATYLSTIPGTRSCLIREIEGGRTVRVTNLDNGRSITCVTRLAPRTQRGDVLVMHTEAFEQLADLTDAPIAVEVRQ